MIGVRDKDRAGALTPRPLHFRVVLRFFRVSREGLEPSTS